MSLGIDCLVLILNLSQPSNYEEFSSRLDEQDYSEKIEGLPCKSELVTVDVSGKSFARMTSYRR